MDVGNSVRKAIADHESGDLDPAMIHACNAIDGTAAKVYPNLANNNAARFKKLLRENCLSIIEPMAPAINLVETVFPVQIQSPRGPGRALDFADILYVIHRCNHNHGAPLPVGFELLPDALGKLPGTRMTFDKNLAGHWVIRFSDRIIFGMLATALLSPANTDQKIPDGYHLTYGSVTGDIHVRLDNDWWGRAADFGAITAMDQKRTRVKLDFTNVMPQPPVPPSAPRNAHRPQQRRRRPGAA
jgi:hypothetical protein